MKDKQAVVRLRVTVSKQGHPLTDVYTVDCSVIHIG